MVTEARPGANAVIACASTPPSSARVERNLRLRHGVRHRTCQVSGPSTTHEVLDGDELVDGAASSAPLPSSSPPAASRCRTPRCGSCARRAAHSRVPVLRGEGSILSAIADPALAAEVTLQPVRRYGVDAAIVFSDIVVPVHAIGFGSTWSRTRPGDRRALRRRGGLARLRPSSPSPTSPMWRPRWPGRRELPRGRPDRFAGRPSPSPATSSRAARRAISPR